MPPEVINQLSETLTTAIAFILFFLIMKKYAWGPVTQVLEERQRTIEAGFAAFEKKQAEAEKLHKEYDDRLRNIEQEARTKIQEAVADGRRVAAEIVENARQEAQKAGEAAQRNIQVELAKARIQLREEIIDMTLKASERLMREKLDDAGQRGQVARFLQDLESEKN